MRKSESRKKSGIKSKWVISYLVVFLMPLLVGIIVGALMYNGFKEQVDERNGIVLNSVCTSVDSHLKTVADASASLYSNSEVNKICREFSKPLSESEIEEIDEFSRSISDVRGYEIIEEYSDTYFLYFSDIDYIVTEGYAQNESEYYKKHINTKKYSYDEWKKLITKDYNNSFFNGNLFSDKKDLYFVRTVRILPEEGRFVNAIYKINTEKILQDIKNLYLYEYGTFTITNLSDDHFMTLYGENNMSEDYEKNGRMLTMERTSAVTQWKYNYTLPADKAYGSMHQIFVIMLILYALCLVAGVWIIRHFIRRNYQPIDKLMTLFPEDNNPKDNEFSYLNEKITESLSKNFVLNQEIDSQSKMIREHLISEMLLGNPPVGKRSRAELENLEFNLETDAFLVMIYSLGSKDDADLSIKQFALCNVTDELLGNEEYRYTSTKKDADVIYIIRIDSDAAVQKTREVAKFLLDFSRKELEFEFYSAMGGVKKGLKSIGESYNEAKRAIEYAIAEENMELAEYSNVSESLKDGYFYSVELESRLVNLLKANEQKKMTELLKAIFKKNIGDEVSLDSIRYLTVELFSTVKRLMAQYGYSADKEFPAESEFVENIFENRDVEKMQDVILNVYSSCGKNVFEALSRKDDLTSRITMYINQNYSNQNLGIGLIGEAFSMNSDYVSRKFREQTGKTINDYIRDVRIEKAKQLLKTSDELIADIAEMVGFTSYRTFVRVFTDVAGVTPNKYKSMK